MILVHQLISSVGVQRPMKEIMSLPKFRAKTTNFQVQCEASTPASTGVSDAKVVSRRTANYQPPMWEFDYVHSLRSEYTGVRYCETIEKLKGEVRFVLRLVEVDPLIQLEHIDALQRLGLSYHFESELNNILKGIHNKSLCGDDDVWKRNNLYATALEFRLLRQHGFLVPQDVFSSFIDNETGKFRACLGEDTLGMLYLYEASFHLVKGETILDEAREFATRSLENYVNNKKNGENENNDLVVQVTHALEVPLHWRMLRAESRWFIDVYERREDKNNCFLELAKLDFNVLQSIYHEDLQDASRWWKSTSMGENLEFARDRVMVNFLWAVGITFEPELSYCRRIVTRLLALITVIDDVYDVYGTLDELELFTNAVERWDTQAIHNLPEYMKICFYALHNSINGIAFDVLKERKLDIIQYLKKAWANQCKSFLLEAKWYHSGYTPTLDEYLENSFLSVSGPLDLVHIYFLVSNTITEDATKLLETIPSLIHQSSLILRLADDLGTSSDEIKRGDVAKSIQCYMNEAGVSEDEARQHVKFLIREAWKQLNEDRFAKSPFSKAFIEAATNLSRTAQFIYQNGDGHGIQDLETKDSVHELFVNPISLGTNEIK